MQLTARRVFAALLAAMLLALAAPQPLLTTMAYAAQDDEGTQADEGGGAQEQELDFSAEKAQISSLSDQYKQLQSKQAQITAQINQAKNDKEKQIAIKQQIGEQIDTTAAQINLLTEKISLMNQEIVLHERELAQKQEEIDDNYELFKERFRAMNITPRSSTVGLMLGAQSYSEFVRHSEVLARVAQHDQDMLEMLKEQKAVITQLKQQIEQNKLDVEEDKVEMDNKKQELSEKMTETQTQIQDIAALEEMFLANKVQLQAQMKQVQAEIDSIYAEIARKQTTEDYVGGVMLRPTPTLSQVTSEYGWRFNNSDFHTGIDFSGPGAYGQPIVAANDGTVIFVNTAVKVGYGYGKYLIIDHGGGYSTLYGHCSAINVTVGQTVSRGQTIAQVGSTGWSTGPHCHFEVRIDGKHDNPAKYL